MPKIYTISLDIGATKIRVGLISAQAEIKKIVKIETQAKKGKKQVLRNIIKVIKNVWPSASPSLLGKSYKGTVKAISIGMAGLIDYKKGVVREAPNFSSNFKNIPLKEILYRIFRRKIIIDNDVNLFTLGESVFGAGRNYNIVLGLTIGTGIGGGLVINRKIYHGKDNVALEVGHMKIPAFWLEKIPQCGCGQKGCFEQVASGKAWVKLDKKYGKRNADKIVRENLALGLANLITLLNPEIVVLGGGLMEHKDILLKTKEALPEYLPYKILKTTKIVKSKLGSKAILLGGWLLAKTKKQKN